MCDVLARILSSVICCTLLGSALQADDPDSDALRVGIKPAAPFVMIDGDNGVPQGFSIDLIEAIADRLDPPRKVEFIVHQEIGQHLEAVRKGEVDLGIGATSYTSERERELEFSVPFFQGGLAIVATSQQGEHVLWDAATGAELGKVLLWVTLFVAICAHVVWFTERGTENSFDDRWHVGIWQVMWWTIVTMTTVGYGDMVPRKPASRVVSIVVIVVGIVLFGVAVGAFSSVLTTQRLQSHIQGSQDLKHLSVVVVRDSMAETTLRRKGVGCRAVDDLDEALQAVVRGDADAAVHDAAVLKYHLPRAVPELRIVGAAFAEHSYGITFPVGSPIRKNVNVALLELMESDPPRYTWMVENWLGGPQ